MLLSMTGFVTKTILLTMSDGSKAQLVLNLKSVNSRFLETSFKIPHVLTALETKLIPLFKKYLYRGHISFSIYLTNQNIFKGSIEPALTTAESYIQALQKIKQHCSLPGEVTISEFMMLPNLFSVEEKELDEATKKIIFATITELLEELTKVRAQEGKALLNDIEKRITIITQEIDIIEKKAERVMNHLKNEMAKKLSEIGESELAETQRNLLFLELDKSDIHEEIVRFKSHLKNLNKQLTSPQIEKGRRFDFTLQELGREINTIAAKSSDATISSKAVNIKVELEKIREQSQNIV